MENGNYDLAVIIRAAIERFINFLIKRKINYLINFYLLVMICMQITIVE